MLSAMKNIKNHSLIWCNPFLGRVYILNWGRYSSVWELRGNILIILVIYHQKEDALLLLINISGIIVMEDSSHLYMWMVPFILLKPRMVLFQTQGFAMLKEAILNICLNRIPTLFMKNCAIRAGGVSTWTQMVSALPCTTCMCQQAKSS